MGGMGGMGMNMGGGGMGMQGGGLGGRNQMPGGWVRALWARWAWEWVATA